MRAAWLQELLEETRRDPPHPGEAIRNDFLGGKLSARDAARLLGVPRSALERVLQGRAAVTRGLALALEALGWSRTTFWLRLQDAYDGAREYQAVPSA